MEIYYFLGGLIIALGILSAVISKVFSQKKCERLINNFEAYTIVLQLHMEKAYEIIHKDKILIYSLEATKIKDSEFNTYSKDFVRLVEKMLGPRLCKEFIFLYGNYETFVFTLVEYFNTTYEGDAIRKTSIENMMEAENVEGT